MTGRGLLEQEVAIPTVAGDQLTGLHGVSMPLEDIYEIEVRKLNPMGTVLLTVAAIPVLFWVGMGLCGLQGKALGEC